MIERRWLIIWQPLQTPSAKVSARAKNSTNIAASLRVVQNGLGPAAAGAEHVTVRKAAARHEPVEVRKRLARLDQVGHVHIDRGEAGAIKRVGHLGLAVDALLAQDRDAWSRPGGDKRRSDVIAGSNVSSSVSPRSSASLARANSASAQSGLSRSRAMRHEVSLHTRCSSARGRVNTGFASHQNSMTSRSFGLPMIWLAAPRPADRSASITALLSAARICRHRAEFLGKQRLQHQFVAADADLLGPDLEVAPVGRDRIDGEHVEVDAHAAVSGKRHFASVARSPPSERSW